MRRATAAVLAAIALGGCKVNDAGAPPTVDVKEKGDGASIEVQPGRMPDVKMPEVKAPDVKLPDLDGKDRGRARTDTTRRP